MSDQQPQNPQEQQQGSPPPPPPPPTGAPGASDERTWAMLAHLAALTGYVTGGVGAVVGPLVVWLIKKDQMPLVDVHGKRALNFQITMLIAALVCVPLFLVLIGVPLLFAVGIADLVLTIMAAVKTSNGEDYKYPFSIPFFK